MTKKSQRKVSHVATPTALREAEQKVIDKEKTTIALANTAPQHTIVGPETTEEVATRRRGRGRVRGSRLATALSSSTLGG